MLYDEVCFFIFSEFRMEEQRLHASHPEAPDKGIPYDHIAEPHHRARKRNKSERKVFLETLGKNLKERREKGGWSGRVKFIEFAKYVGITPETLKNVEEGKVEPTFNTLYKLSSALQFPITIAVPRHPHTKSK
jgi:ribosome-binding protein aMBF1 (putative translation factor)